MTASGWARLTDVCWLEQQQAFVPPDNHWLGASELRVCEALRFPKRKADWRLGRWTAKHALAPLLFSATGVNVDLSAIEILPAPSGAPEAFWRGSLIPLSISLTHRSGVAACAVTGAGVALGCDLEIIEPRSRRFVADYFTAGERTFVESASQPDRELAVAVIWSAKESVLKALRTGLREDTRFVTIDSFDSRFRESPVWLPLAASTSRGERFTGWWHRTNGFVRTLLSRPACDRVLDMARRDALHQLSQDSLSRGTQP